MDPQPPQKQAYYVRPDDDGREGPGSEGATVVPTAEGRAYLSIKLDGTHTFQKVGIADLDGDGLLDFVIKQPNTNVDPYEKYWKRSTNTYKLEAYRSDGTFLWRYDLGWAIECGIWYSPYVVFDFDGDGRAEVAVKTGEGDPRDPDGRVTSGPEYLSILDGRTGKERTRVEWPSRRASRTTTTRAAISSDRLSGWQDSVPHRGARHLQHDQSGRLRVSRGQAARAVALG